MKREHYNDDQNRFISEMFEEDRKALLPLPQTPFETSGYTTARTDKYGKFTLDNGKHRYSASPAFCEESVRLRITSSEVIVMDRELKEITHHRRLYGDERESMDWLPYLKYIARKPRSLKNSGIYAMMPESMQIYMDKCEGSDRGKTLKILAELTERSGFDSAINTVNEAIKYNATDPDSLENLYRRTYADVPLLPPLDNKCDIALAAFTFMSDSLSMYDAVLKKGGASNG